MSENILNNIISKKIERVDALKKSITLNSLNEIIDKNNTFIDFKEKDVIESYLAEEIQRSI